MDNSQDMKALNALGHDQLAQIIGLVLGFLASADSSELIGILPLQTA